MTYDQANEVRRAIKILTAALNSDTPAVPAAPPSPVRRYVIERLVRADIHVPCSQLWIDYSKLAAAGHFPQLTEAQFYRELTVQMREVWGAKKRNDLLLMPGARHARGFSGFDFKWDVFVTPPVPPSTPSSP